MRNDPHAKAPVVSVLVAWSRRDFLRTGGTAAMTLGLGRAGAWAQPPGPGDVPSPFLGFEREIEKFMSARKVPGAALAVVKDGRLVYTRGYGWADRESKVAVKPTSLFRIASISKPFTAVAVLKLVEAGKLDLNAHVFDLLASRPDALRFDQANQDVRWRQITVRHLLQHTGGWDRDKSFDPMFRPRAIAKAFGIASPPTPRVIIRYMLGQPLDFDPGTRYAYSNFGYCVLGRIIEKIGGTSYEKFVQEKVLAPIGVRRMRIGASLEGNRVQGEVRYYMRQDDLAESVFDDSPSSGFPSDAQRGGNTSNPPLAPPKEGSNRAHATVQVPSREGQGVGSVTEDIAAGKQVPWPYGGFCLESMDAHGGWIASAVDLARFAAGLHDPQHSPLLKPKSLQIMHAPPEPPVSRNSDGTLKDHYYGCGWLARPVGQDGGTNYWHTGSLPGTSTLLVRRHDGVSWMILFNQRSDDDNLPDGEIDAALHRAANAVTDWPKNDLFRQYQ